jgi:putative spermidine/putrescine transport system ATP-binding protein
MSYLQVTQLNKHYGQTQIFNNIDFSAKEGEFVTLLGPSGCGKSTLLRCLAGLTSVDSGKILLQGQDIVPLTPQKRGIGMVFQSYALFPNMTVEGNVAFGLKMQNISASETKRRVAEVLKLVELDEFSRRYPHQLSGGQCQRVALARSLVTQPRRRIQREMNLTAIFVTHDQEEALTMSDRIVLMNKGQIVQNGDAETLYTAPVNAFAAGFIGSYNLLTAEQAYALTGQSYPSQVAVRPESIALCAPEQGIPARIINHSLLGNVVRYRVVAHNVELSVDVLNRSVDSLYIDGTDIGLQLDLDTLREVA